MAVSRSRETKTLSLPEITKLTKEWLTISYAHTWAEPDLYILADEDLIETSRNTIRRLCQIEKHPDPVIAPDRSWEGFMADGQVISLQDPFYATVLFDPSEGIFRCWYRALNRYLSKSYSRGFANQSSQLCYALSSDGIEWEKPVTKLVLYDASYENNMLRLIDESSPAPDNYAESMGSIIPYSALDSEDRFVASIHTRFNDAIYPKGITVCFSPDGLRWRMHFPPVLPLDGDCNSLSQDPTTSSYLLATRSSQHANLCRRWGHPWKRHIALSRSRDLFHWTPAQTVLEADERDPDDTELYKMYIMPYGHAYLGQLLTFYAHEMVLEGQLALSRDLKNWQRVGDRQPILTRGAEGSWDSKHVTLSDNPPHPEGEKIRFWYGGASAPHYQAGYGALGTGTLRRDGFVCYEAGKEEGVLTTIPFRVDGATWIILNVDVGGGEVRAEVTDKGGNPIDGCSRTDCIPIQGDHTRVVVNFKTGPGRFSDRGNRLRLPEEVRFRFYLKKAKLYAFKAPCVSPMWLKPHNY